MHGEGRYSPGFSSPSGSGRLTSDASAWEKKNGNSPDFLRDGIHVSILHAIFG